jgi:hypothetical protein
MRTAGTDDLRSLIDDQGQKKKQQVEMEGEIWREREENTGMIAWLP